MFFSIGFYAIVFIFVLQVLNWVLCGLCGDSDVGGRAALVADLFPYPVWSLVCPNCVSPHLVIIGTMGGGSFASLGVGG